MYTYINEHDKKRPQNQKLMYVNNIHEKNIQLKNYTSLSHKIRWNYQESEYDVFMKYSLLPIVSAADESIASTSVKSRTMNLMSNFLFELLSKASTFATIKYGE